MYDKNNKNKNKKTTTKNSITVRMIKINNYNKKE